MTYEQFYTAIEPHLDLVNHFHQTQSTPNGIYQKLSDLNSAWAAYRQTKLKNLSCSACVAELLHDIYHEVARTVNSK